MKVLSKLFNISAQYLTKQMHYKDARLGGKIVRLVFLLICVAASVACTYGAKHFFTSRTSIGELIAAIILTILAVGLLLEMLSHLLQYAIIGFRAHKSSSADNPYAEKPTAKKSDIVFGIMNILFILILIAGDVAVLLI